MLQHDLQCANATLLHIHLVLYYTQQELIVETCGQVETQFRETVWSDLSLLEKTYMYVLKTHTHADCTCMYTWSNERCTSHCTCMYSSVSGVYLSFVFSE